MGTQREGFGFFFGLLVGSLVGASVAIILAPQSGDETREMIKERANDAKHKASDFAKDLKEDSKELLERAKASRKTKEFEQPMAEVKHQPPVIQTVSITDHHLGKLRLDQLV